MFLRSHTPFHDQDFPTPPFPDNDQPRFIDETLLGFPKYNERAWGQKAKKNPQPISLAEDFIVRVRLYGSAPGTSLSRATYFEFCTTQFIMCQGRDIKMSSRSVKKRRRAKILRLIFSHRRQPGYKKHANARASVLANAPIP